MLAPPGSPAGYYTAPELAPKLLCALHPVRLRHGICYDVEEDADNRPMAPAAALGPGTTVHLTFSCKQAQPDPWGLPEGPRAHGVLGVLPRVRGVLREVLQATKPPPRKRGRGSYF